MNKLPPKQIERIPGLINEFNFIKKDAVKARKSMIKRLENIKFMIRVSETAKNQESIYNIRGPLKISNNNNNTDTDMDSKFSDFQIHPSTKKILQKISLK